MNKAIVQQWMKCGPGCIAWKGNVEINPSKLERDWLEQLSSPTHRSEILQFTGSPFALEDLRSVLVSHLHDKGGTKSALHPGDHTSLRWGEVLRAKTALQPPVTAARKCCISARCCMVLWAGMLLSDACCLSSLPQTNVNSCSASSESPTRHNLSFLAPCPALPFISQGMKWIPLIQSPQWQ